MVEPIIEPGRQSGAFRPGDQPRRVGGKRGAGLDRDPRKQYIPLDEQKSDQPDKPDRKLGPEVAGMKMEITIPDNPQIKAFLEQNLKFSKRELQSILSEKIDRTEKMRKFAKANYNVIIIEELKKSDSVNRLTISSQLMQQEGPNFNEQAFNEAFDDIGGLIDQMQNQ